MVGNGLGCITVEPLLLSNKDTSLIRTLPTVYSFMEIVTKLYAVGGYYVIPRGPGQRGSVCVCVLLIILLVKLPDQLCFGLFTPSSCSVLPLYPLLLLLLLTPGPFPACRYCLVISRRGGTGLAVRGCTISEAMI